MIELITPLSEEIVSGLRVGDTVEISGYILCGRDAVLPKILEMIENDTIDDVSKKIKKRVDKIRNSKSTKKENTNNLISWKEEVLNNTEKYYNLYLTTFVLLCIISALGDNYENSFSNRRSQRYGKSRLSMSCRKWVFCI